MNLPFFKISARAFLFAATAGLSFAETPAAPASGSEPPQPKRTVLRFQGSNTIGAELIGNLVIDFLKDEGWKTVQRVPTGDPDVYSIVGVPASGGESASVEIVARGTNTAWEGLESAQCDFGMASRRAGDAELLRLKPIGDLHSPACEHVLALDGVAILVNPGNALPALSREQLHDIFIGKITDWTELNAGLTGPINVYARDDRSGTYDTFKSLVLGKDKLVANARRFEDSRALSDAITGDRSAIGFSGLAFVRSARALAISDGGAAMLPTPFTVRTEDYPLSRRLFLYSAATISKPLAVRFLSYAKSDAGQRMAAATGFVDQIAQTAPAGSAAPVVSATAKAIAPGALTEYQKATNGAERVALNIRFRPGVIQPDNKALADLDRLKQLLNSPEMRARKLILLGFSDSKGDAEANLRVSEERARAVAKLLQQRGLTVGSLRGFGAESPVSSNETADGRDKNRRVEIWVRG